LPAATAASAVDDDDKCGGGDSCQVLFLFVCSSPFIVGESEQPIFFGRCDDRRGDAGQDVGERHLVFLVAASVRRASNGGPVHFGSNGIFSSDTAGGRALILLRTRLVENNRSSIFVRPCD
jgi:hypothetical protein